MTQEYLKFPSGRTLINVKKDAKKLAKAENIQLAVAQQRLAAENGIDLPWNQVIKVLEENFNKSLLDTLPSKTPSDNQSWTDIIIPPSSEPKGSIQEIKRERRRIRQLLPKTGSSLMSAICEHKIIGAIDNNEPHCLVCGYHGRPTTQNSLTPDDGDKSRQPVYYVSISDIRAIVKEAGNKYRGLEFGDSDADKILSLLLAIEDKTYNSYVKLSKATTLLRSLETTKMPGGANKGLNDIIRALNTRRVCG
ncbi:hypothetical protein [Microbulbifer epialgicus]|uniref:Uncharacterized protein n=1 Tax=Microbulbifer epialgicus TaxID=393907 RepID=A0ABV4NU04_9GAMM